MIPTASTAYHLPYYLYEYSKDSQNYSVPDFPIVPCIDPNPLEPAQEETLTAYRWTAVNKTGELIIQDVDEKAFLEFANQCANGCYVTPVSLSSATCGIVRINSLSNFLQDFFIPLLSHEIRNFKGIPRENYFRALFVLTYCVYLCIRLSIILVGDIATLPIRLLTLPFRLYKLIKMEKHPLQKQYNLPDHVQIHCLAYRVSLLADSVNTIGTQKNISYKKQETKIQLGFHLDFAPTPAYKINNYLQVKTKVTNNASRRVDTIAPPTHKNLARQHAFHSKTKVL